MMASEPCIGPWSRGSHLVNGGDLSRSGEKGDRAVSHQGEEVNMGSVGENRRKSAKNSNYSKIC